MSVSFRRLADYPTIRLSAPYAPQYAAAGDDTLIDGLRGNDSFKTGRWQGYRMPSLTVDLDMGAIREIRAVSMGFLQDTGSWIFMPRGIEVEASADGRLYTRVGATANATAERQGGAAVAELEVRPAQTVRGRYLRVLVSGHGALPPWHPGAGEMSWFFADEIIIR